MDAFRGTIVWPAVDPAAGPWLWSARHDRLWIAGLGSLVFAAVFVPLTIALPEASPLLVTAFAHLATVCNYPHYAATYQLIWRERGRARASYGWLLGTTPLALGVLVYASVYDRSAIGALNRIYLTWSAYHYAAQHFGIASMYQARQRRALAPMEKRLVQAGFVAMAVHLMLLLNMRGGLGGETAFGANASGWQRALLPAGAYLWAASAAALGFAVQGLAELLHRRRTGAGLAAETRLLFIVNVAWFVVPYVHLPGGRGPWMGTSVATWLPYAQPFFHCLQYLAVCGWRARTAGTIKPVFFFMGLVVLGLAVFEGTALALRTVTPAVLAQTSLLVPAVVNIHHFVLDGVMWKARRRPKDAARPSAPPRESAPRIAA